MGADQSFTACCDTGTDARNWTIFHPSFLFSRTPLNQTLRSTLSSPEVTSMSIISVNPATSLDS
jgi:hypothetical protein